MENLLFTFNIVAPVFVIVIIGVILKKRRIINDNFVEIASRIVFSVTLPALVFVKISQVDLLASLNPALLLYACAGTFVVFIIVWFISKLFISEVKDRAVFIQGSFRSNFAIIGLALISNMFGPPSLAKAAILLVCIMPFYNILSVIALNIPKHENEKSGIGKVFKDIITNPLIAAGVISLPFAIFNISLNSVLITTVDYLAGLTLPLALLAIGGSFSVAQVKDGLKITLICCLIKIVLVPVLLGFGAYKLNFTGEDLGILLVLFACPTAVASYIMAVAMNCNGKLAGNIVLTSTLFSMFSISGGIFILRTLNMI